MEGVMIVKDEDRGLYKCSKKQKQGVSLDTRLTDDIELRENQAERLYNQAYKAFLASANDASDDFVLIHNPSSSASSGGSTSKMLCNQSSQPDGAETQNQDSRNDQPSSTPNQADDENEGLDMTSSLLRAIGGQGEPAAKAKSRAKAKAKQAPNAPKPQDAPQQDSAARATPVPSRIPGAPRRPKRSAASPKHSPKIKKARGRVSATAAQESDESVLAEEEEKLNDAVCDEAMTTIENESELIQHSQEQHQICQSIIGKLSTKIAQIKRRKQVTNDTLLDKMKEVLNTATIFSRLYGELANTAPKAAELQAAIEQTSTLGFNCGLVASVKLVKAQIMDLLKYGRYDEIAKVAVKASAALSDYADESANDSYFIVQVTMTFEQVIQKLLRVITPNQARFGAPGVSNMQKFLTAAVSSCEQLPLPAKMIEQLDSLQILLTHNDKTILPNKILEIVKKVRKPAADEKVFWTFSSLPQGGSLITQAEDLAKKRLASESSLIELAELTKAIYEEHDKNTTDEDLSQQVTLWERLLKLEASLADKEESANVSKLKMHLTNLSETGIANHSENELVDFLQSQIVHASKSMKMLEKPVWKVDGIRKFLPDHAIFRTD